MTKKSVRRWGEREGHIPFAKSSVVVTSYVPAEQYQKQETDVGTVHSLPNSSVLHALLCMSVCSSFTHVDLCRHHHPQDTKNHHPQDPSNDPLHGHIPSSPIHPCNHNDLSPLQTDRNFGKDIVFFHPTCMGGVSVCVQQNSHTPMSCLSYLDIEGHIGLCNTALELR